MKKLFVIVSLLLVTVMLFGCQGKTDNSTTTQNVLPPQEYNKTFTLQGKVMNAITGVAIGSDPVDPAGALQMFLIQGDADRGPTKLHTDQNDPLVGEYSISGIPADRSAGEAMFKVVVKRSGYQDFAANVNFDALVAAGTVNLDGTLNKIGNIYLFPIGSAPGSVVVNVFSLHGIPVPGVTVLLQQDIANVGGTTAITGNRLVPVAGLYPSMTAVTDANGVATFSGANLVLGGSYNAVAEAIDFQGDELATTGVGNFIIGINTRTQPITMGVAGTAFFATSASNQVPGVFTPGSGVLSVNFNEPISLSTTFFTATLNSIITGTVTNPVVAVLSNNNQTLTLTPTFTTTPTGAGARITYAADPALAITLVNSQTPAVCGGLPCTLFAGAATDVVNKTTGVAVSGTVQLIAN